MHIAFWGFPAEHQAGLLEPGHRYAALSPATGLREPDDAVPRLLRPGWAALERAAPAAHRKAAEVAEVAERQGALLAALEETPQTLVHGDWKFGNLGRHRDGRTILLDWGWPGRTAPLVDLGWYLAVNCDRLPESKEDTLSAYREGLEARGVQTGPWWERQLELALLGAFVQLGWSKTHDPAELGWWTQRITRVDL
jgi:aminoglycoside phosphotransferase (APT) family kinase protein